MRKSGGKLRRKGHPASRDQVVNIIANELGIRRSLFSSFGVTGKTSFTDHNVWLSQPPAPHHPVIVEILRPFHDSLMSASF
jgi:hypothetical protein